MFRRFKHIWTGYPYIATVSTMHSVCIAVIAHGSSRRTHIEFVEDIARRIESALGLRVAVGYLDGRSRGLADAEEVLDRLAVEGCRRVAVVPFFLTPGRHAKEDVPRIVESARSRHRDVEFIVTPCIGEHSNIVEIVVDLIKRSLYTNRNG